MTEDRGVDTWQLVRTTTAAAVVPLAVAAAASDLSSDQATWVVAADVAVGVAFGASGFFVHSTRHGTILSATGVLWLVGSVLPAMQTGYRGLLVLALASYPVGRLRIFPARTRFALAVLAAAFVLPLIPAAGALAFATVAVLVAANARPGHRASWAVLGASAVAVAQLVQAAATQSGSATARTYAFALYQGVLVSIAITAIVADRRRHTHLRAQLGRPEGADAFDRLSDLLSAAMGDPTLRIEPAVDPQVTLTPRRTPVADDGIVLAVIAHEPGVLDDAPTAQALTEAVRLVARHERLLEQQRGAADDVAAARSRLLAAEQLGRARLSSTLHSDVTVPVAAVADELRGRTQQFAASADTIDVVVAELDAAVVEADLLLAGLPALPLGDGRLREALATLAERSPLPVVLHVAPDAAADSAAESTAYAVSAEALTNAIKHGGATRLLIDVRLDGDDLIVAAEDDGDGGADASGSGLSGLSDQVAGRSGSFRVLSPAVGGTRLEARIPREAQPIRS